MYGYVRFKDWKECHLPYTVIDHTADIGIRITGADIKDLFHEAARALVAEIGADIPSAEKTAIIEVKGYDFEDLLVVFLNELLYEIQTRNFRVSGLDITSLSETNIRAIVKGKFISLPLKENIKAVTYHNLSIIKRDKGYETTIIFDV
jgi:SHS2 domain-containing protein